MLALLRDNAVLFKTIFDRLPVGVSCIDLAGQFLRVNPQRCAMLGYGVEDLCALSCQSIVHPLDLAQMKRGFQALIQGQMDRFDLQRRDRCKDGTLIWVKSTIVLVHACADEKAFFLAIEEDITDQKQAEESLLESDARLRALFEQVKVGINHIDVSGQFLQVNPAFCKMLGYTEAELLQLRVQSVTHAEDWAENLACIRQLFAREIPYYAMDKRFIHRDGTIIWASLHVSAVCDQQGVPKFSVAIVEDISERKRLEDERKRAETALKLKAKRERLLNNISQRIRQSLELSDILAIATAEVRQLLNVDRVILAQFEVNGHSTVISESVVTPYLAMMGYTLDQEMTAVWTNGQTPQSPLTVARVVHDQPQTVDDKRQLQQFTIQTNLVVPIVVNQVPWGFLSAHCCATHRLWPEWEVDLLEELGGHLAIAIQQSLIYEKLQQANQELKRLVMVDGLTQIANRRCFDEQLAYEWARLAREQSPLGLIFCDIDYFKGFNDTYGHLVGDDCLQQVAEALAQSGWRASDLVARYGGEEFAIILPNTDELGTLQVAEQIRQVIFDLNIPHRSSQVGERLTVSLGAASIIPRLNHASESLVLAVDQALYKAKQSGRNRVCLAESF
ncbi:MAG: PAS domain S-box protein [Cyanobacteria bacterium P01_A01_bin.123]